MTNISDCTGFIKALNRYFESISQQGEVYFNSNNAVRMRKILMRNYLNCQDYLHSHCKDSDIFELIGTKKINIFKTSISETYSEAYYCLPKSINILNMMYMGKSFSYDDMASFENRLRNFINTILTNVVGTNWINSKKIIIDPDILKKLEQKIKQHNKSAIFEVIKGKELEYMEFRDYETIIMNNFHHFNEYFSLNRKEKQELFRRLQSIRELRNPIAHTRPPDPLIKKEAELAMIWFEKAFDKLWSELSS